MSKTAVFGRSSRIMMRYNPPSLSPEKPSALRPTKSKSATVQAASRPDSTDQLHDSRLSPQQRQSLAAQIGHAQGNHYLQRALSSSQSGSFCIQRSPETNFIEGTTDEMKSELARLQRERNALGGSCVPAGHRGGQNCPPEVAQYNRLIAKLDTYLAERSNSTLPDASIELIFDGKTLNVAGSEIASFSAVSGKPDGSGSFSYTPERQRLADTGPIPEGIYWIDPKQLKSLWYYFGDSAAAWGSHRITIHPFHSTPTFGRGGFFIHGGSTPGSAGCIDLTSRMADLAEIISRYEGNKIKLNVRYPRTLSPNKGDFPTPEDHYA